MTEFLSSGQTSFKGPSPRDIANRVSSTAEEKEREAERFDELNAVGMACRD